MSLIPSSATEHPKQLSVTPCPILSLVDPIDLPLVIFLTPFVALPRPQSFQVPPANPRATPPRATSKLKAYPYLSYCSWDLTPTPTHPQFHSPALKCEPCCDLPFLSDSIPKRSQRTSPPTYPLPTLPSIPASNTNRHSLWTHQLRRPGKQASHNHHIL